MLNASTGWAVGNEGSVCRTTDGGATWAYQASGTTQNLMSVWGSSANDVWAVGNAGVMIRWDGTAWGPANSGVSSALNDVWGTSSTNIWAVGTGGLILRWNGTQWTSQTSGTANILRSVWGLDANNVWACGALGTILKWNGTNWTAQTSGITVELRALSGVDASNVWAVGAGGNIRKWNGSSWSAQTSGSTAAFLGIWVADASNAWAVGTGGAILKWNGSGWAAETSGTTINLNAVTGSGAANVLAAGEQGSILQRSGSNWPLQLQGTTIQLNGLWGANEANVWAVGENGVTLNKNGAKWNAQVHGGRLNAVWGSAASNVWASGEFPGTNEWWVLHWVTNNWEDRTPDTFENQSFAGMAFSATDVLATSPNRVWRWNGASWTSTNHGMNGNVYGIWGTDPSNVWVVGNIGQIRMWNGSTWSEQTSGTSSTLYSVWGSDTQNIWAVGVGGQIRKWNGSAWTTQTSGTSVELRGVAGKDASNIWAVGQSGTILRWNGSTWSPQSSGTSNNLYAVWVDPATGDAWAAGASGLVLTTAPVVPPAPADIAVSVGATSLTDAASTVSLGSITVNVTGQSKTFTITNTGGSTLTGLAVQKDGDHAGDFSLGALGSTTLAPAASTTFTVTFTPSSAGNRNAALHIASNVAGAKNPFDVTLLGKLLQQNQDTDSDGMNDASEFQLAALGFDWEQAQSTLVNTLLSNAPGIGFYTPSQMQTLNVGTPLIFKDASGQYKLTLGIKKSTELSNFTDFPMSLPQISINPQGKLEFLFTVPDSSVFFRVEAK